jgi:hypothetical protein
MKVNEVIDKKKMKSTMINMMTVIMNSHGGSDNGERDTVIVMATFISFIYCIILPEGWVGFDDG